MRLTAGNTAIVLDSTADLPDAADRFANWRVVSAPRPVRRREPARRRRHRCGGVLPAALAGETRGEPGFRLGIAPAAAPAGAAELEALIQERRSHADLELVVTPGAVIGSHAGPGTLALFWFPDD